VEVEHTLKWSEKKYGYICILSHNRKAFSKLKGKRFVVKIGDEVLLERHLDPKGRIYLSIPEPQATTVIQI
jgi:hypothetical protein